MENLKPNDRRARNAVSMIWVVMTISIISSLFLIVDEVYLAGQNYATVDYYVFAVFDLGLTTSSILYTVVFIASAVTFIMWFRRAYYNLHQLKGNMLYGEGWAAGGWFIPVLNLYMPYQIMKDLYTGTNKLLSQNLSTCTLQLSTSYLGWWWFLWLFCGFVRQLSVRSYLQGDSFGIGLPADVISTLLLIPLAMVTVIIIKDYAAIESALVDIKENDPYNIEIEKDKIEN